MNYPKFEKANDNVIRIITERSEEVPLAKLIETKKLLIEKIGQMNESLKNINEILDNAEQLGITLEENK